MLKRQISLRYHIMQLVDADHVKVPRSASYNTWVDGFAKSSERLDDISLQLQHTCTMWQTRAYKNSVSEASLILESQLTQQAQIVPTRYFSDSSESYPWLLRERIESLKTGVEISIMDKGHGVQVNAVSDSIVERVFKRLPTSATTKMSYWMGTMYRLTTSSCFGSLSLYLARLSLTVAVGSCLWTVKAKCFNTWMIGTGIFTTWRWSLAAK